MEPERLRIVDIVNKIFGEAGWSFSISNVTVDYVDDSRSGNYSAGASAVVRVQRTNGVFREDVGFGSNSGSNKADVISRAKKDAVTDGLRGAVINFGGDMAQQVDSITPRKASIGNSKVPLSHQGSGSSYSAQQQGASPPQAAVKPNSSFRSFGDTTAKNPLCVPVKPSVTTAIPHPKSEPVSVPTKLTPLIQPTSPLAVPLPQRPLAPTAPKSSISEEELAKIERKKRQKQLQEEFRKKHEQAQAQSKAQDKGTAKPAQPPSREPLKEQQKKNQSTTARGNGPSRLLDDDEVMLSTQDMEALTAAAVVNTANVHRHSPMLSSPSITRNSCLDAANHTLSGMKRPDLSNYAFNPEKKQRS